MPGPISLRRPPTTNGADIAVELEQPLAYNRCENTLVWIPDMDFSALDLAQDHARSRSACATYGWTA